MKRKVVSPDMQKKSLEKAKNKAEEKDIKEELREEKISYSKKSHKKG